MNGQAQSAPLVETLWKATQFCESRVRKAQSSACLPGISKCQATSKSAFPTFSEDCGQMADNDNRKPADREETWESLGDVIARLLRKIAEKRGAA